VGLLLWVRAATVSVHSQPASQPAANKAVRLPVMPKHPKQASSADPQLHSLHCSGAPALILPLQSLYVLHCSAHQQKPRGPKPHQLTKEQRSSSPTHLQMSDFFLEAPCSAKWLPKYTSSNSPA
jgi:hypothetical protein